MIFFKLIVFITIKFCVCTKHIQFFNFINLPEGHLSNYFNAFPNVKNNCLNSSTCEYKPFLESNRYDTSSCWGFEKTCTPTSRYQTPLCDGDHTGWVQSKEAQLDTYYDQADFGYIRQQIDELTLLCEPKFIEDSSLECTSYLRFCRGRNLMLNFTNLKDRRDPIRYNTDVLKEGEIGGYCKFNKSKLMLETEHMGALQSWSPELRNFDELPYRPIVENKCDILIDKPTFIMKIDSNYNMYHHFCDFFNLYATLFVNQSHPFAFHTDTRMLVWETYRYESPFASTFKAFTDYPVWNLDTFKGKVVCFKNLVLPLLPRMIFGLFYNTPIIYGCEKSGLFRSFSEFILHRLKIPYRPSEPNRVRITFLVRKTKYRQVLNEDELLEEISYDKHYFIRRISFDRGLTFIEQLQIVRNTDILIGMHGAGLTHLLFLPDWASVFELHNCEDPNCYKDLARLRGIKYFTWENESLVTPQDEGHHPKGGAHAKFTNYYFDKKEFARIVRKAADHVLNHSDFLKSNNKNKDEL